MGFRVRLNPGGSYHGRKLGEREEDGALRLHSSANRGIFVRFLFENKTLPTTLEQEREGRREEDRIRKGCGALSGLVSFVYMVYMYSTTNALISSLAPQSLVSLLRFSATRDILREYLS